MISPKALAARWQSTRLNWGIQGWRGRVKPLQHDKGRCNSQHPRLQEAREGMVTKKHCCAPKLLVPTTSHTSALLPALWGGDKALCFHKLLPQRHVLAPLSPPRPGTPWGHRCAGWGHMHAPTSHLPSQC